MRVVGPEPPSADPESTQQQAGSGSATRSEAQALRCGIQLGQRPAFILMQQYAKIIRMISDSTQHLIFKKLSLVQFDVISKITHVL